MKKIIILLILVSLFACTKQDEAIQKLNAQRILVLEFNDKSTEINFDDVVLNATKEKEINLFNSHISDEPLEIKNIVLPKGFSSNWTKATLKPGEAKPLRIAFTPTELDFNYEGVLQIESNKTAGFSAVKINGNASELKIIIKILGDLNFGTTLIDQPITKTIKVQNLGTNSLAISDIKLTNNTDFSLNWTQGEIQPKNDQEIAITFNPKAEGDYDNQLEIISNATEGTSTLKFTAKAESNVFTDPRDGKTYSLFIADGKIWMKDNFAYAVSGSIDGGENVGHFYTSSQALSVAPSGWHLSTDDDWKSLERFMGMNENLIDIFCQTREDKNTASKLLAGISYYGVGYQGNVYLQGERASFWTSTEYKDSSAPPGYYLNRIFEISKPNEIKRCAMGDNEGQHCIRLVKD